MNYQTQCPYCYDWFFGSHVCSKMPGSLLPNKTAVLVPLTEQRVREIVREELQRKEQSK